MTSDPTEPAGATDSASTEERGKPRIKIGSQRDASLPRVPPRVKTVFATPEPSPPEPPKLAAPVALAPPTVPAASVAAPLAAPSVVEEAAVASPAVETATESSAGSPDEFLPKPEKLERGKTVRKPPPVERVAGKVPLPNLRSDLPTDLAEELDAALGQMSLDELIAAEDRGSPAAAATELEAESRHKAKVVQIYRDSVFVDLGTHQQGVLSLRQFVEPPEVGQTFEVIVARFDADEGLYELTLPGGAVAVGDFSSVSEGMAVEALVTGHNSGGLECEVNKLRAFIPISQIALYRVEQIEQFVGQKFTCVVTEVNAERGNLVLSRRAMLEREQAEAKQKLLAELEPGQTRDGIVRSLRDFGAFVDLGGVDGLLHVSQISWDRIKHPGDVLQVGQKIRVKIERIDPDSHKISLNYRDLSENPWANVVAKYPVTSRVKGTVSKLTEFGAFVRLEAGVEGLIHISELAHQRIHRVSDAVTEGQEVEVKVLSVDPEAQRISLSLKAFQARPEPAKKATEPDEPEPPPPTPIRRKTPLKGGLGRGAGGADFGLKW